MDIGTLDAILFFATVENYNIKSIDFIDQENKIAYFTLKDGREMYCNFGIIGEFGYETFEFYFEEEI